MLKFPHEMLQGQRTEAEPHYEEQVVGWVDKGLVLLPSAFSLELQGGGSVFVLRSHMGALDYLVEPSVDCLDTDLNDAAFI
jgi:hypothetical protein